MEKRNWKFEIGNRKKKDAGLKPGATLRSTARIGCATKKKRLAGGEAQY